MPACCAALRLRAWPHAASFRCIGDVAGGGFSSGAQGISGDGLRVVGQGQDANKVSANGTVVAGPDDSLGARAIREQAGGPPTFVGGLNPSGNPADQGRAWSIAADASVVVGSVASPASTAGEQAFGWTAGGGLVGMGFLGLINNNGISHLSKARDVSGKGSVTVGSDKLGTHSRGLASIPRRTPPVLGFQFRMKLLASRCKCRAIGCKARSRTRSITLLKAIMQLSLGGTTVRGYGLLLAGVTAALACATPAHAIVVPGDTFTFSIAGFNTASGTGYILGTGLTAVFGTTQTFAAAGVNGQAYTISSSEVVGATTTTDSFRISTPTNFITTTTVNGITITQLQFDIGTANSGVGVATGPDPVNFLLPITTYTAAGNIVYGTANTIFTLTPNVTLAGGGLSFTTAEGVNTGTTAITGVAVHDFNFSITYANPVPEASTWAMMLAGFGVVGGVARRRARAA